MWEVTLKQLRDAKDGIYGYNKVVCMLSGKEFDPERETYMQFKHEGYISLIDIAENIGLGDALWSTRCLSGVDRDLRLYAVWCARQVSHTIKDQRSLDTIDIAERFANGEATAEDLATARSAAWSEWRWARDAAKSAANATILASRVTWVDAKAKKKAARGALAAASSAARTAAKMAWDAARAAAWTSAMAAARFAPRDVARSEWAAATAAQKTMFIKMCRGEAPWQRQKGN